MHDFDQAPEKSHALARWVQLARRMDSIDDLKKRLVARDKVSRCHSSKIY